MTPPIDYELIIEKVQFYFNLSRENVLELTLEELFKYFENGFYWFMESIGKPQQRPSTREEKAAINERHAYLKKLYNVKEVKR